MKPRILIVEDDEALREMLKSHFASKGWEIQEAADFSTAKKKLENFRFDVVSTDMDFPGGSGLHVLKEARSSQPGARLIMFSGNDAGESIVRSLGGEFFLKLSISHYKERMEELRRTLEERCDCVDCEESGEPCSCDCDREEECRGCFDARTEREEIQFTIDDSIGRR